MTNREFFESVINASISDEITAHAQKGLDALDKKNASRSSKPSKTQIENEPIKALILEWLIGKSATLTKDIADAIGYSPNKVGALCRQLRDCGKLIECDVKVTGAGMRKAYKLAEVVGE